MTDNVSRFFEKYKAESALRARIDEAVACYPGSLEVRESVAEYVLLPIAESLELPFTIEELRKYETRLKLKNVQPDEPIPEGDPINENPPCYWLLDKGWENDPSFFKK